MTNKAVRLSFLLLVCLPIITTAKTASLSSSFEPTKPDYIALAADWHMTINRGNPQIFIQSFHSLPIKKKIINDLHLTKKEISELKSDLDISVKSMAEKMTRGYIRVLSVQPRQGTENQMDMLIRLDYGSQGLMYIRFELVNIDNTIRVTDWLNYSTGMTLSETLKRLYSLQKKLSPNKAKVLNQFYASVKQDDFEQALSIYKKLPAKLHEDSMVLLLKAEATASDEPSYIESLAEFAERFGEDPRYAWIMVDHYYYQQDYKTAHKLLELFANQVMQDAAIYAIQGSFAYVNNDYSSAIRYCQKALKLDPDYRDTYLTLLYSLIANQNFKEAVLVLQILQKRFQFQLDPMILSSFDGFSDFSKSESFIEWAEKTMSGMERGY